MNFFKGRKLLMGKERGDSSVPETKPSSFYPLEPERIIGALQSHTKTGIIEIEQNILNADKDTILPLL